MGTSVPEPEGSVAAAGSQIPVFSGTTDDGRTVSDVQLRGHPAVLYFYPKASSMGCTIEAREFARHHAELAAAGVRVVGISIDSPAAQSRFRSECHLPFDLVADASGEVSRRFGVRGRLGLARRTTFLVDRDGKIVEVVRSWRPLVHVRRSLARFAIRDAEGESRSARTSPASPSTGDPAAQDTSGGAPHP